MRLVISGPKAAEIQALLDMEGIPGAGLLIKKHPHKTGKFDFGVDVAADNLDVSPSELRVFVQQNADRPGTFRIGRSVGRISLKEET